MLCYFILFLSIVVFFFTSISFSPVPDAVPAATGVSVDITFDRNWHALKYFGQYFYGIMFGVMAVLFTLRFWEIHDYTDRDELRNWLRDYISDGWSRRGGLRFITSVLKACAATLSLAWLLFTAAREMNINAMPEPRMIGGGLALVAVTLFLLLLVGYPLFRAVEGAFTTYVSQNVAYSSTIILKRVLKAKTELGLCLMVALYSPMLYFFTQALIGTSI